MWEPVGPLPASVYRRRRWLAFASVVLLFAALGMTVAALTGGPPAEATSSEPTALAANRSVLGEPATATDPPVAPVVPPAAAVISPVSPTSAAPAEPAVATAAAAATASGVPGVSGTPVVSTGPGTQIPPTSRPATAPTDELVRQDDTPRPSVAVPPAAPVPATGPVPCTKAMLSVGAEIDRPDHKVGDKPVLRLVVTNVSDQPCVRDLDGSRLEIVVWSGDGVDRLWSSNDCVNPKTTDLRTLIPGQPVVFAVTWLGRTTSPGCTQPRTRVPAGAYRVMTRVDDLVSAPTPFLLTS
jgi:hypothetical protein